MANPAGLYLAGPGGKFDLTDPRTSEMVKQISADPNKAPQYGVSLAEVFALQNMLKRFQQQPPQAPQTTVVQDLKNQLAQARNLPPEETGIGSLPSHNFQPQNFAGGGIVAFDNGGTVHGQGGLFVPPNGPAMTAEQFAELQRGINPNRLLPTVSNTAVGPYNPAARFPSVAAPEAEGLLGRLFRAIPGRLLGAVGLAAEPSELSSATLFPEDADISEGERQGVRVSQGTRVSPEERAIRAKAAVERLTPQLEQVRAEIAKTRRNDLGAPRENALATLRAREAELVKNLSYAQQFMPKIAYTNQGPAAPATPAATETVTTAAPAPKSARPAGLAATPEGIARQKAGVKEPESEGMQMLKAAQKKREELVDEAAPKTRGEYKSELEEEYKKAGIGGADAKRAAELTAREGKLEAEHDKRMWLDASKAGFKMAAAASKRGATFLGSAAAGGEEFADAYGKTMDAIETKRTKLADAKYDLDKLEEARKMGIIDKTDSRYKEAKSDYAKARHDLLTLQERAGEMVYSKEAQERIAAMNRASTEKIAAMNRAAHYNVVQDLMEKLKTATPAEREKLLKDYEAIRRAEGKQIDAADIRRSRDLAVKEIEGLQRNKDYLMATPEVKKQMENAIYEKFGIPISTGDVSTRGFTVKEKGGK